MSVTISAADVNKLRQITGAGMMDCRKALAESNGDFEKAIDYLRLKGQKVAANRMDRDAKEGVAIAKANPDGNYGVTINKGIDGTLELAPMEIARKLNFSMRATFSYNRDKLLENGAAPYEEAYLDPRGQNINASQGYIAEGIFQRNFAGAVFLRTGR